ncbi:DUF3850 domain-containing protein [Thomasclavelia sp.]|uniref:DUF3850 domain-containing protein n=1 Tax=Thomasclavelia sp. TaxID=3025757 RepID=UPI0025F4FACD|nr:DUF3850 domain-containing protein [Thomasclavelia sp.]
MKVHNLKIEPKYFYDVIAGVKKFEVRKNDRDFKVGDYVFLEEYDHKGYTGKFVNAEIIYILDDQEYIKDDYVVLGIELRIEKGAQTL